MTKLTDGQRLVRLDLPADAALWSLARMEVSAIAANIDLGIDAIEDVRVAVSELCSSCALGASPKSRVLVECSWDDDELNVACSVSEISQRAVPEDPELLATAELSRRILEAMVDEHEIEAVRDGTRSGWFRKGRESVAP